MNNNLEDLEERYNQFSDEEIIRLFSSGNLTELAQSVALNELKLRHLAIPFEAKGDNESMEIENLEANMRVIAENLTVSEANILCGLIQSEGIPADVGDSNFTNLNSPFPSAFGNAYIRVPFEYIKQAMDFINAYNQGKYEFDDGLVGGEDSIEDAVESDLIDELTLEQKEREILLKRLKLNPTSAVDPSYKTTESHWFGFIAIFALFILAFIIYQKISGISFIEIDLVKLSTKIETLGRTDLLLLIISPLSYFVIQYSFAVLQKGAFDAKNGNTYTKANRPIGFWFEVIGGVILGLFLFVYGVWLIFNLSIT